MYDDETEADGRISTIFREATAEIEPDVPGLVRGGVDRGRIKRRRRNAGVTLAAVATAAVVGVTASAASGFGSAGVDPAPAAAPSAPATTTTSTAARPKVTRPTKPGRPPAVPTADIPVEAADLPRLFSKLHPGKITPAEERTGRIIDNGREGQYAHFLWNGFTTTVGFAAYSGTPAQRCRELQRSGPPQTCVPRPDGSVSMWWRETAPAQDGGGTGQSASLFTKDGYEIFVVSYNWARKGGPNLAEQPPFSIAELTRAVTSDVWY